MNFNRGLFFKASLVCGNGEIQDREAAQRVETIAEYDLSYTTKGGGL